MSMSLACIRLRNLEIEPYTITCLDQINMLSEFCSEKVCKMRSNSMLFLWQMMPSFASDHKCNFARRPSSRVYDSGSKDAKGLKPQAPSGIEQL